MKTLKIIKDKSQLEIKNLITRKAVRGIFFDEDCLIPLLYVKKNNYHKLPGGGIEDGETHNQTLIREFFEEAGSKIKIIGEIGKIIEYRNRFNLKQISYCYFGKILKKKNKILQKTN
ncbi:MAG: NUDIX domain-containing protein [Patescibacteria group bacterium]|nr:NUDIX domain-containing protein [Patescibacteria group bacterium]